MAIVSNLVVDLVDGALRGTAPLSGQRLFAAMKPFGAVAINVRCYPVPRDNLIERVFTRIAPPSFMPVYGEERFYRDNPLPAATRDAVLPFAWSDIAWTGSGASWVRGVMHDCGCPDGIVVPCHGPRNLLGMVSIAFADLRGLSPSERRAIEMAAHFIYGRMVDSASHAAKPAMPDRGPDALTRREADCLRFVSEGYTTAATAAVLGVSAATVATHLANARAKLGAKTRAQAVASFLAGSLGR